jgi:UDPglucose 6-dehydrogenase
VAKIAIVGGAGYVGVVYAAAFAELGHDVTGIDVDAVRISMLCSGGCPIYEPGLAALLRRGQASGRLRFTVDYDEAVSAADFVFVCVGTPMMDASGRADIRSVIVAVQAVARHARGHTVIVNKSTMPVGSVELVSSMLAEYAPADATFSVVSNPEFLREGSAIDDVFHPDRIVLGTNDPVAAEQVAALYAPLGATVLVTDPRSAEMVKYASNAFLAAKISFINEVAMICEGLGADVHAVARGMGLDQRINSRFLSAGAGFGGSCFPKDVRALAAMARDVGMDPTMLSAVLTINTSMRSRLVDKVATYLGGVFDRTIGVLGLAFKPNTDDIREAPALEVIQALLAKGARVRATDPAAIPHVATRFPEVTLVEDAYAAATGCDAVLLMTEWDDYRTLDLDHLANAMRGRLFLDGRNALDPAAVADVGLVYLGMGRTTPALLTQRSLRPVQLPVPSTLAAD